MERKIITAGNKGRDIPSIRNFTVIDQVLLIWDAEHNVDSETSLLYQHVSMLFNLDNSNLE